MHNENLTFEDLLYYVDCFCLMLKEQGFSEEKIKEIYLPVTKAIILNFKDRILDERTEEIFIATSQYQKMLKLLEGKL